VQKKRHRTTQTASLAKIEAEIVHRTKRKYPGNRRIDESQIEQSGRPEDQFKVAIEEILHGGVNLVKGSSKNYELLFCYLRF